MPERASIKATSSTLLVRASDKINLTLEVKGLRIALFFQLKLIALPGLFGLSDELWVVQGIGRLPGRLPRRPIVKPVSVHEIIVGLLAIARDPQQPGVTSSSSERHMSKTKVTRAHDFARSYCAGFERWRKADLSRRSLGGGGGKLPPQIQTPLVLYV